MKRSDRTLMGFVREVLGSQRARQRAALLAFAILAPACGGGGGGGNFFPPTPGAISFQLAAFTVNEPAAATATATITVTRSGGVGAVSVNYATSNGTAGAADYTATNGTLAWANGDVADKTFTVTIASDAVIEGDETVNLTLSGATGGAVLGLSSAVLVIKDFNAPLAGVVQFDSATYSVVEGIPTVTITVTRTGGTTGAASVNYGSTGGTATGGGVDYTLTAGVLNWAAGDGAPKTFTVAIVDDAFLEATETVLLGLNTPSGAALGTTSAAILSIIDNDSPSVLQLSALNYNVSESGVQQIVTVSRTGGVGGVVGVTYATSNGTAIAGVDYTAATGTLSWAAGDSADKTFTVPITDNLIVDGNRTVNLTLSAATGGATLGAPNTAVLTIQDDDCTLQFTAATYNIPEGAGASITVAVSRTGSTAGAVSVDVANPAGGTATAADYTFTPATQTLTWPIGDGTPKTISIPIIQDALAEGDQTFNLLLSNAAGVGAHLGTQTTSVATIVDDDVQFVYSAATYSGSESGGAITVTVNRVGASNGIATVDWTITGGTATIVTDYAATPATLTWASGDTTPKTFAITPVSDNNVEGNETVLLLLSNPTLVGGNSVTVGAQNTATVTIVDDDTNLQFSLATYSGAENAGAITVTVTRTGITTGTSTVTWAKADVTTSPADYTAAPGLLTFAPGVTSMNFTITPVNDSFVEGAETLNLSLTGPTGATLGAPNTAVLTILDDDVPNATIGNVTLPEGNLGPTNFTFTITLSAAPVVAGSVTVNTANGTVNPATAGVDYTAIVNQVIPFGIGVTSMPVTVVVNGDTIDELNETFFVNLTAPVNLNITGAQGTGTITNDDDPTILIASNATTEGNAATKLLPFTVTLSHASLQDVVVNYSTANVTATAGSDYVAVAAGSMTITAGNTTGTINITINGDTTDEADETFTVTMNSATNTASITTPTATGTILNDDAPTITINSIALPEGTGATTPFSFTVFLSNPSFQTITVNYSTADGPVGPGGAVAGSDYTAVTSSIVIPPGNSTFPIVITVNADSIDEADETFTVTLTSTSYGTITGPTGTGTIVDDDGPSITITNVTQAEGNGGTSNFVFTVNLSAPSPQAVSVDFTTVDQTATAGSDYVAQSGTLIIPALSSSGPINIVVNGDLTSEPDETFKVVLSNPVHASIAGGTGTGTILTDDVPGISITPSVSHPEGNSGTTSYVFTVSLTNAPTVLTGAASVSFQTFDVTANAGSGDYTALPLTALNWPVSDGTTRTITVLANGDTFSESDETFNVILSGVGNANIIQGTGVGTIVNDDGPAITITGPAPTFEGNGAGTTTFAFTVTLSAAPTATLTVNYQTADGTATVADGDYTGIPTTGLIWLAGDGSSRTINVLVNRDNKFELDETFTVNLSGVAGGSIAVPTATATILNDDGQPTISINDVSQAEGNSGTTTFNFNVTLSNPSYQTVTVTASTADGTAQSTPGPNQDYQQVLPVLVTFPPGNTSQLFPVTVFGDTTVEPNETFFVNLTGASPGSSILDAQGQGTILNDEGPSVTSTTPFDNQTNVNRGTHLVVNFSMAMDPATVTGSTVSLSPDPSGGAVTPVMQFFWNAGFTQLTIVFDTKLPVGVYGDDLLGEGVFYTVTIFGGGGGVKSSVGTGSLQMSGNYTTHFTPRLDSTPPFPVTISPDPVNPIAALTTTFTVTFNEAMNKTTGRVQIRSSDNGTDLPAYNAQAQLNPPSSSGMTLGWNLAGTVLTINLSAGLPAGTLFRLQFDNFSDLAGNGYWSQDDIVLVTPIASDATKPTIVANWPPSGASVARDGEVFIFFSEGMWPADMIDPAKIVITTSAGTLPTLKRSVQDVGGVFISPKKAWPGPATIQIQVLNTVRDAAGLTLLATQTFTFITPAGDTTNPPVIDAPFSTVANNDQDLQSGAFQEAFTFKNSGTNNRIFLNMQSLAPQDVTIVEKATGIPVKGYEFLSNNWEPGAINFQPSSWQDFTGFNLTPTGDTYTLTFKPSIQSSTGVAMASTPIDFKIRATGGNSRPSFSGGGDARYKETPGGVTADFQLWAGDVDGGTTLTVTAQDSPNTLFSKTLTNSFGQFQYQTPSGFFEPLLTTLGVDHTITFTVTDSPGGHSLSVAKRNFIFNNAFFPTLPAPTTLVGGRPTFNWGTVNASLANDAMQLTIDSVVGPTATLVQQYIFNRTQTNYRLPVDKTLPAGNYQYSLSFYKQQDGSFQGQGAEGITNPVAFFIP